MEDEMNLTSRDFRDMERIPSKFTCDGEDISPQLKWGNQPKETKSFALSCIDPDAPGGDFIHWFICNIPAATTGIPQGGPAPGVEIENDFRKREYGGPCPPPGTHRYVFTVYALDTVNLGDVGKGNFLSKVEEHTLEKGTLTGKYSR
ncbi:MAG: YbhB/YbcL family Raf kinase inhibitor-like protein [Candidatus Altiarchaeales archaeon]|nr:YbhB/YbcL family Raf kinase inhibitor-like protein [Candidatus Altiarchaeales archaeon]